jgi:hypothetical protein
LIDNVNEFNNMPGLNASMASDTIRLSTITGRGRQVIAESVVIETLRNESSWVIVIDIDGFLVPVGTDYIPQI